MTGYSGNDAGQETANEPGALDNRLSVNVNDPEFESVGFDTWEDGDVYTLANVKVRQVSPGEFEVVSIEKGSEEPEGEETVSEADEGPTPGSKGRTTEPYENPAVASMM